MVRKYIAEDGKSWEGNKRESEGYRYLMAEIRTGDFYDPYAVSFGWLVALEECIYVHSGEIMRGFQPSPMLTVGEPDTLDYDSYPESMVAEIFDANGCTIEDMRRVYAIMYRYDDWVRLAGQAF